MRPAGRRTSPRSRQVAIGLAVWLSGAMPLAARGPAPLPPVRPSGFEEPAQPRPEPEIPAPDLPAPVALPGSGCLARLSRAGHVVEPAPPPAGNGVCTITEPVRIRAVAAARRGSRPIALPEGPLIACELAEPLAAWLGRVAAPAVEHALASPLVSVRTGPGYECRGRNRQAGAKLSAHAFGRAVDIAAFVLADGRALPISAMTIRRPSDPFKSRSDEPSATLDMLRLSACSAFTTVLGPGDPYHGDHLHLDVERRGRDGRSLYCQ